MMALRIGRQLESAFAARCTFEIVAEYSRQFHDAPYTAQAVFAAFHCEETYGEPLTAMAWIAAISTERRALWTH